MAAVAVAGKAIKVVVAAAARRCTEIAAEAAKRCATTTAAAIEFVIAKGMAEGSITVVATGAAVYGFMTTTMKDTAAAIAIVGGTSVRTDGVGAVRVFDGAYGATGASRKA